MEVSNCYPIFDSGRNFLILVYNLIVLSSVIATATRDLHRDIGDLPVDPAEFSHVLTRPTVAQSNEAWRRQMLHAAATVASSTGSGRKNAEAEGRHRSFSTFQTRGQFGSTAYDYSNISEACSGDHGLEIQQDNTTFYFEGLPVYRVMMINTCLDCSLQDVHIACGDWASATEVNPQVFKRIADNDCVVNDGKPIVSQGAVMFEYTNSFPYPMVVQSSLPSCT